MACGTPIVASGVGGVPEIVHDGVDGVLVPPNSPARLADEVVRLLERPEQRHEIGEAARQKVLRKYTLEAVVDATVAVYEEVIARYANRRATKRLR